MDGKYGALQSDSVPKTTSRKAPHAYFYMSKAYLSIHKSDDADLRETYEVDKLKALKNALKYANKFVKKDREKDYIASEQEFIEEVRKRPSWRRRQRLTMASTRRRGLLQVPHCA